MDRTPSGTSRTASRGPRVGAGASARVASILALALGIPAASAEEPASPPAPAPRGRTAAPPAEAAAAAMDAFLSGAAAFGWSGSALVARDGEVLLEKGYGAADAATGVPNGPDTLFEIASATKPFTACAVLRLEEQGKLSLDDSIAKHLPGVPAARAGITLRHLLAHTSGMPRSAAGGRGPDLAAAVAAYLAPAPARSPGAGMEYWNGGYALLAGVVERVSGETFTAYLEREVFGRAGMESSGFTGDADLPAASQAVGRSAGAAPRRSAEHPYGEYGWQYRGMGGMVTTVRDLWRFALAYEAGRVLAPATVRRMEEPVREYQALGWAVTATKRGTRRVGHGGSVRGFHCYYLRFPEERAAVVVLANTDAAPVHMLAWNLEAMAFGEALPYPSPPAIVPASPAELDGAAGSWERGRGERLVIERSGAGIRVVADGPAAGAALRGQDPPPPAHAAKARELLEAVRRGDAGPVAAALADGIPRSWPATLVGPIWKEHLARWGECRGARLVDASPVGADGATVLLGLEHEKGEARLKVVIDRGRLRIFDLDGPRALTERMLLPVEPGLFASFSWSPVPRGAIRLRFEGPRGAPPRSVVVLGGKDEPRFERAAPR